MKPVYKPIIQEIYNHSKELFGGIGILRCGAKLGFPMSAGCLVIPFDKPDQSMDPVLHVGGSIKTDIQEQMK